jgi:hypothetical protein
MTRQCFQRDPEEREERVEVVRAWSWGEPQAWTGPTHPTAAYLCTYCEVPRYPGTQGADKAGYCCQPPHLETFGS